MRAIEFTAIDSGVQAMRLTVYLGGATACRINGRVGRASCGLDNGLIECYENRIAAPQGCS